MAAQIPRSSGTLHGQPTTNSKGQSRTGHVAAIQLRSGTKVHKPRTESEEKAADPVDIDRPVDVEDEVDIDPQVDPLVNIDTTAEPSEPQQRSKSTIPVDIDQSPVDIDVQQAPPTTVLAPPPKKTLPFPSKALEDPTKGKFRRFVKILQ